MKGRSQSRRIQLFDDCRDSLDFTGLFPILHVFAEPMKNRKNSIQIKAVTTIIKKLKAAGLRPTFHILDNEVSTDLIAFLEYDENITVQLAPAGCYCRNAA